MHWCLWVIRHITGMSYSKISNQSESNSITPAWITKLFTNFVRPFHEVLVTVMAKKARHGQTANFLLSSKKQFQPWSCGTISSQSIMISVAGVSQPTFSRELTRHLGKSIWKRERGAKDCRYGYGGRKYGLAVKCLSRGTSCEYLKSHQILGTVNPNVIM